MVIGEVERWVCSMKTEQRAPQHQVDLVEGHASPRHSSLREYAVAESRPRQDANEEAERGEREQGAELLKEAHDQAPVETNLDLGRYIPEHHARKDRRRQASERHRAREIFRQWPKQIAAGLVDA